MATIDTQPAMAAAPTGRSALTFAVERFHIHQRCLGTLAHELGNIASPIALVADVLHGDSPEQQRVAAVRTLRLVAATLGNLTSLTRIIRGGLDAQALAPRVMSDLAAWWAVFRPFAESMLPHQLRIEGLPDSAPLSTHMVESLAWCVPAVVAHLHEQRPAAKRLQFSARTDARSGLLQLELVALSGRVTDVPRSGCRWMALARFEASRVGGSIRMVSTASRLGCKLQMPTHVPA